MLLYLLDQYPFIVFVIICYVRNDLLVLLDKEVDDVFLYVIDRFLCRFFRFHDSGRVVRIG